MKHIKLYEAFGKEGNVRDPREQMEPASWEKAKKLKMVVLAGDLHEDEPVYFVIKEEGDMYQVVIDEKMDIWFNNPHKASKMEMEEYYTEWDKKSAFVEYKLEEGLDEARSYKKGMKIIPGKTRVIYDGKKGTVIDQDFEEVQGQNEKMHMLNIEYDDNSTGWELADDVKMKFE